MTPEEIAAAEAAKQAADAAKPANDDAKAADAPKQYDEAYVKGLRTEAQNYRLKLKAIEEAEEARKLAELSENEQLKAKLDAAEKKARALEIQQVRMKAANKFALPEDLHEFLTAEDEDGAEKQAKVLAARLVKPADEGTTKQKADLPGAGGRQPSHSDKAKGFTPEEQRENDRRMASRW